MSLKVQVILPYDITCIRAIEVVCLARIRRYTLIIMCILVKFRSLQSLSGAHSIIVLADHIPIHCILLYFLSEFAFASSTAWVGFALLVWSL